MLFSGSSRRESSELATASMVRAVLASQGGIAGPT